MDEGHGVMVRFCSRLGKLEERLGQRMLVMRTCGAMKTCMGCENMRDHGGMRDHEGMWNCSHRAGVPHREPARQGGAYFCEEPLHAALLVPQVAVLVLINLAVEAFARGAEILGHSSDCLVFSFKCLPLLQLLVKRTHVIYLITHPEILPLLFLINTKGRHCHQYTNARASYSLKCHLLCRAHRE